MKNNNLFKNNINHYEFSPITIIPACITIFATCPVRVTTFLAHCSAFVPCLVRVMTPFTHGISFMSNSLHFVMQRLEFQRGTYSVHCGKGVAENLECFYALSLDTLSHHE